ncbi:hypothetical protein IQ07DRAFT_597715 [Pyrenochaeta sp. DS3sAY3a]|nr:hypothetical protein IQ07DRAFT_597715 [Pyrenochaeta sp. DS3sAY3a]
MNAPPGQNPQPQPLPSTLPPSSNTGAPTSPPPMPTDTPLALLPPSDQLSDGAKAGISVSVSFLALSIFLALGWYIRRLKRELKAVQRAAAGIPPDIWHASIATATAPAPGTFSRQPSSSSSSSRGRRASRHISTSAAGRSSPVSPLSPRAMEEVLTITDNGYGVLKKKRGHVLSVVVEREEEEGSGASLDRVVWEPVAGQREGLVGPLELDGGFGGLVELPAGVATPRERSVER